MIQSVLAKTKIDPKLVGDVVVGNVLADQSAFMARIGSLLGFVLSSHALTHALTHTPSGLPDTVPVSSVNRQCSSGLQVGRDLVCIVAVMLTWHRR